MLSFTRLPCTVILEFCSVELTFSNTSRSSDRSTSSSGSRHQQTPSSQNRESPRSAWRHPRSPSVLPFLQVLLRDRNLMVDIPLHAYLQRVLPLQLCSWLQRRRCSCCCWRCSALAVLGMSPPTHRRPSSCWSHASPSFGPFPSHPKQNMCSRARRMPAPSSERVRLCPCPMTLVSRFRHVSE